MRAEIERLAGGPLDAKRIGRIGEALDELHKRFVSELPPETQPAYLKSPLSLAAYLAWFHPASVAQVQRALVEVRPPDGAELRVLDVGSGPGPASLAVGRWAAAHRRTVAVTACEQSPLALESAKKTWDPSLGTFTGKTWVAGEPLPAGPFDVIVASHVLNELFPDASARLDKRAEFAQDLASRLSPGGLLVLVEPALKRTGRELLVVRDRLLTKGLSVLAPCFLQGACPAIARPRDWCHADRPWDPPALALEVGKLAGLGRESLKYAYVILTNRPADPTRTKDQALFRVVSEPLPEKGKKRYFACGPSGRHALVRLDREANETNAAFDTLERGDVVRVENTVASGDGKRVGADVKVEVVLAAKDLDG